MESEKAFFQIQANYGHKTYTTGNDIQIWESESLSGIMTCTRKIIVWYVEADENDVREGLSWIA